VKKEHLNILVCPVCGSSLKMMGDASVAVPSSLCCIANGHEYIVRNGIPRFVNPENYAESFGFQWTEFSKVQLDSHNGTRFSEDRFQLITQWSPDDLAGKLVLDAGCGAGRFAEVALKYQANLVAFDLSQAVDVTKANLSPSDPLLCQASIYELPFKPQVFDFVYCIGVVQHTPDPVATIRSLCRMVKPSGCIGLWIYERDWKSCLGTLGFKYALRPFFARMPRAKQYDACVALVNLFFPLVKLCKSLGLLGRVIMRLLPVASAHVQLVPLSSEDLKKWILLDTFDMYSPSYDYPQTYPEIAQLLAEEGFVNIKRQPHGGIAVTAVRQE